jgi:alpha-tubulin suppressor-like RCC1 family protein
MGMAQGEDYDIYLYNSEQSSAIGVSNVGGNYDENIEYTPTTTGIYYLEVMPYSSTSANHNYQLMIYSQDCPPDSYEPNDGHLAATPVTAGSTTAATINVSTDEDWFVLDTTKTGKLNITLKNIPMGCDYDLEVFKDDFITPIDGSYSCTNYDEKITRLINETGKYYIRVYHATGSNASVPYELQANVYTSDAYEVNDDAYDVKNAGTPSIDLGSYTSATIDNPDDIDFFKFTINSSTNVGLRLQNIPEGMDYDLELYSYDSLTNRFSMISGSTCVSNYDETIINQLSAGSYYVKVCSYSGSSETQNYKLSVTDENAGEIKIEFDKTNASVGEIITARIKVKNVPHLSGYQVNLKYDPQVIDPVDKYQRPYKTVTVPESGDILINQDYWPYQRALHDFDNGILNFGKVYLGVTGYKESGVDDNTGTLAIVQFKVIKNNMIKVSFEASSAMPGSSSGVDLFDWDGEKISGGYTVDKSVVANSDLPENPMSVSSLSEDVEQGVLLNAFETYRISGCIGSTKTKENFTIKILRETEVCAGPISTDSNGLFNFLFSPTQNGIYKIVISKEGHLTREIGGVTFGSNIQIGSRSEPLSIWAGDVNNDDAINISDIMILATRFNKVCTYDTDIKLDLNGDNAINISDVMIMAGHFNRTVSNYPKANIIESPRGLVSVSAGEHHSVALKEDGTVLAWGRGICGQLGDGKGCSSSQPVKVNLNKKIVAVSAGTWHTVFLTEEGEVYWCGKCVDGNNVLTPTKVVGIPTAKAIAAGENYTLVLTENGDVYSWGVNYNGQLGYTTTTQVTSTPQKINSITGVEAISARSCYSLALKNGEIYEWGSTVHGDLTTPSKVVGISNAKAIAAGGAYAGSFAVVLKQDGTAIEYGTKLDCGTAVQFGSVGGRNLGEFQNAISVSAGANHAVILKQDGSVYTLGENNKGQLGNGGAFSNTPVKVPGLSNVIAIAAGAEHTLAITGGTYYAWGDSADGKLGDGQDYIKTVPSEIAIPENIAAEDDARLDYISVNDNIMDVIGGKSIYGYSCIFGSSVPTIQAVPVNEFATVDITPPSALPGYANIVVTSQNGKIQKAYRVKVELCSYGFIEQAGEIDIYEFTSPTTGTYSISSEGNIDTYIKIFDGETEIATCDDSAQDNNFYLDVSLEAGKTYTLKVGHSDETGTGPYRIIIGTTDRADLDYSQYEVYLEDLAVEAGGTYERLDSNKARVKIEYKVKVNEVERTEEVVRVFSGKVINDRIVITQMEFDNAFTGMFSGGSDIQASSYQDDSVGSMYYLLPKNPLGLSDSDQKYLRFRFYETSYGESDANNDAYNSGSTGALTGTIDNIRRIQELLQKLKCWVNPDGTVSKCSATGGFFEVTKASIQKFQREYMYAKESEVTGKVDKETKLSLEKYNLIWQLYGNGVKPEGVRVREYLAKWHNIYNGVGFEQQHVTINNEPLEIGAFL